MKNNEQNDDDEFENQLIASEKYAESVSQYIDKINKKDKSKKNRKIKTPQEKLQAKLKREEKKKASYN